MCDPCDGVGVGGKVGPKVGHRGGWLRGVAAGSVGDLRASGCREVEDCGGCWVTFASDLQRPCDRETYSNNDE